MDLKKYLIQFEKAADQLDKKILAKKQMDAAVITYLDSAVLKLYKHSWASPFQDPLTAESRIFFSVWVSESEIEHKKMAYNIHALKLRKLKGYKIESRKFADAFRTDFKAFEDRWPNVSTSFGPLTLMQGWVDADLGNIQNETIKLAKQFFDIDHLIDNNLQKFR